MSQREILGGERRAGAETSDGEQSKEEQHRRQRYPHGPSSHTKRKSMYNQMYGVFGRDRGGEDVDELWRRVRERLGVEDDGSGEERITSIRRRLG